MIPTDKFEKIGLRHVRESGFWEVLFSVESRILGFDGWNTAKGIWNPTNDWTSESTFPEVHEFK